MLDIKLYMAFSNEVSESFGSGNLAVLNPYVPFSLLEAFLLSWCIAVHLSRLANFSHCSISFFVNVHLLASGMFFIEYLHSFRSMVFMETGIIQTESARPVQLGAYQVYMWQMSSVFSHESAQRNDAGHLIDKNVFKTTRSFCYQWRNHRFKVDFSEFCSICLKSGNTKQLVAKWPCCFKDIFIY